MTKTEFLEQLNYKLRVLPDIERQDALDYYDGYISDANGEGNAMAQLGSPGEVAAVILADYVAKEPATTRTTAGGVPYTPLRRSGFKTAWVIILAVFAVPVGLPLVIALGATAFGLFVGLAGVVFSLWVSGVVTIGAGLVGLLTLPFIFVQDVGFGLTTAGSALVGVGVGIFLIRLAMYSVKGFSWIARFVGKKILRRSEYGRPAESSAGASLRQQ
ncbi:MAG: DUF1700 domain-containing protein [Defluviitaleaceae bacterium]|nr:DUF1700 domain-containing protein [Defluviitaleaceae bacterium]MCL2239895.1 DUF1700 domain-containing protein [Defluviitaleaceae bacterium]